MDRTRMLNVKNGVNFELFISPKRHDTAVGEHLGSISILLDSRVLPRISNLSRISLAFDENVALFHPSASTYSPGRHSSPPAPHPPSFKHNPHFPKLQQHSCLLSKPPRRSRFLQAHTACDFMFCLHSPIAG